MVCTMQSLVYRVDLLPCKTGEKKSPGVKGRLSLKVCWTALANQGLRQRVGLYRQAGEFQLFGQRTFGLICLHGINGLSQHRSQ